jgi:hypothetical protein
MKQSIVLGLIVCCLSTTPVRAACNMPRFPVDFGTDISTSMSVSNDSRCEMKFWSGRSGNTFESIRILERPQHGIVAKAEGFPSVAYRPNPGFRGADSFSFIVSGRGNRGPKSSTIRVSVTVQ